MYLPMPVPQHVPFLSEKQHLGDLGPWIGTLPGAEKIVLKDGNKDETV